VKDDKHPPTSMLEKTQLVYTLASQYISDKLQNSYTHL